MTTRRPELGWQYLARELARVRHAIQLGGHPDRRRKPAAPVNEQRAYIRKAIAGTPSTLVDGASCPQIGR